MHAKSDRSKSFIGFLVKLVILLIVYVRIEVCQLITFPDVGAELCSSESLELTVPAMGSRNSCLKRTPNRPVVMATEQDNSNLQVSFSPDEGAVKAK